MSPIVYIEARCDECNDEIYSGLSVEFALLRNGRILCKTCGDQKTDRVQKWFSIPIQPEQTPEMAQAQLKEAKALALVEHIEAHLQDEEWEGGSEVMCKICNKTMDEIYEETTEIPEELDDKEVVAEEPEGR